MSVRSFIAIDTPEAVRIAILDVQAMLKLSGADVRWEPPEKFHATIKFLGNVDEILLPKVVMAIQESLKSFQTFEVAYTHLGCFPSVKWPRVIWLGCVNIDSTLRRAKEALDHALLTYGFEEEEREFHPHITLGRVRNPKALKNLIPTMESLTFEPHPFRCNEILLMKSTLKPQGSEYSRIHSFTLL